MDAMAYHLEARAPFHFGLRGVGIEATAVHGPSDTFFSALCQPIRQQFNLATLQEFLAGYSSPDPFDPGQAIRFFPRPLEPPPGVPAVPKERKTVKKIAWVSEQVFRAWVVNNQAVLLREWIEEATIGGQKLKYPNLVQGRKVWLTANEREKVAGWRDEETDAIRLWAVGDVPRVTVDRRASTSTVYQAGRVWFPPGGGLFLLVRWREDWQKRGELALQVLGDAGVGGERSAGHGLFRPHGPHALSGLPDPTPGGRFLTLSLYYPTEAELAHVLKDDNVSYRLRMRRGWMASPDESRDAKGNLVGRGRALRRKAVRMFAEGSILRWPNGKSALGDLANVTPNVFKTVHPVYRYGYAYAIGYRPEGGAP
jgi:CRISPR-associated protein Csm4